MISAASLPANSSPADHASQANSQTVEFVQDKNGSLLNGQSRITDAKLDKWNLLKVSVGFDVTRKGEILFLDFLLLIFQSDAI